MLRFLLKYRTAFFPLLLLSHSTIVFNPVGRARDTCRSRAFQSPIIVVIMDLSIIMFMFIFQYKTFLLELIASRGLFRRLENHGFCLTRAKNDTFSAFDKYEPEIFFRLISLSNDRITEKLILNLSDYRHSSYFCKDSVKRIFSYRKAKKQNKYKNDFYIIRNLRGGIDLVQRKN